MRILITGAAGFVGSHVVEHILKNTDWHIVCLDRLDLSGTPHRLTDMDNWEEDKKRISFVWWDLKSPLNKFTEQQIGEVDYILHLAASSHVDRSIEDPMSFVMDNVVGTVNLLDYIRTGKHKDKIKKAIYFSTDEVFGPAPEGVDYKEWDRHNPGNPYAASKSGADAMWVSNANTYKLPLMLTQTMNVVGERQHPEKFLPLCIRKIRDGETITIHANKEKTQSGSRFYIHARNVADALLFLLTNARAKESPYPREMPLLDGSGLCGKYNIVGEKEISNLDFALLIGKIMGKDVKYELTDFHSQRPGHDLRYSLDGSLMKSLGWEPPRSLEKSLEKTVSWYLQNEQWLNT